jgi:hypothetical protein
MTSRNLPEPNISTYHGGAVMVNVKDRTYWGGDEIAPVIEALPESTVEVCYENAREVFWEDAREIAREHDYSDVFSDGRSDGWLGVMSGGRPLTIDYDRWADGAYGPCDEWEQYERDEWERFRAFAVEIAALLADAGENFRYYLRESLEDLEARREANAVRSVN